MPPVTAPKVIDPLLFPHVAAVVVVAIADGPFVLETVAVTEKVQLFASLTDTV